MKHMLPYLILSEKFSLSYIQLWDHMSLIFLNKYQFILCLITDCKIYVKIQVYVKHHWHVHGQARTILYFLPVCRK